MNLNQVTIYTHKPLETVDFYIKLGLKLIVDSLPRYARLECPDGDSTLSIHIANEAQTPSNIVLYFECEDLDRRVAELKSQDIRFSLESTDQSWLWREAHVISPDNSKIILFRAGENRKNPPWRVTPESC